MASAEAKRLLRVQTVLFETEPGQIWRLMRGLDAAARQATAAGLVGTIEWALGDSSPSPILDQSQAEALHAAATSLASVSYEFFGVNLGSSGGQNRLARASESELLLVLNPDTYPAPNALVELVRAVDRPQVGIADARQIPLEHPKIYDLRSGETSWASGACMMLRSSLFQKLDGFDDEYFMLHCDDVDLSWRARTAGWNVVTAPRAVVFHDKRPTRASSWPAPDHEIYHSLLGRLMLATRWGAPEVIDATVSAARDGDSKIQREAVAEYEKRRRAGRVPAVAPDPSVAQFIDGEYAVHRF